MTTAQFLGRLHGVKPAGSNKWMARCPAHDDTRASLSICSGDDDRVLLHCHAGCAFEDVISKLGLETRDLSADAPAAVARAGVEALYDYKDERGTLLYQVVRQTQKRFFQRRPDGAGGWINNLDSIRRVPFGLPELRAKETVYICEGEKDALSLRTVGLTATTNAGGAGRWTDDLTRTLVEAHVGSVVILPDNDDPGRRHADQVAQSAHAAGLRVRVVELPNLPPKGDVSDWLGAGNTADHLQSLVAAAAAYAPDTTGSAPLTVLPFRTPTEIARMTEDNPEFLCPYIARGSLTELTGYAKKGKTSLLAYMVGCIAHGVPCLDKPTIQTGVVWLTEERLPTFRAALARNGLLAASRVHIVSRWDIPASMTWPEVVRLAETTCEHTASGLLIVDTLPGWSGQKGDKENNAGDALEAVEPLQRAAAGGLAVVSVRHDRKGGGAVGESGRGSSAFAGAVDTLINIKQPEGQGHPTQRLLTAISRFDDVPESLVVERTVPVSFSDSPRGSKFEENLYRALGAPGPLALQSALTAVLGSMTGEMTMEEIKKALPEIAPSTITKAVTALHPAQIGRRGGGKKGDPYVYRLLSEVSLPTSNHRLEKEKNSSPPRIDGTF